MHTVHIRNKIVFALVRRMCRSACQTNSVSSVHRASSRLTLFNRAPHQVRTQFDSLALGSSMGFLSLLAVSEQLRCVISVCARCIAAVCVLCCVCE